MSWQRIDAPTAIRACELLVSFAVALQSIELLKLRRDFREDTGIWRWSDLRRDYRGALCPLGLLLTPFLSYRGFEILLSARLVFALDLMLGTGEWSAALLAGLAASSLLISLRFRGSFNGGSDAMTFIVLAALAFARGFDLYPRVVHAALGYVALQLVLSYAIAGLAKLARTEWRQGRALAGFAASETYAAPPVVRRALAKPCVSLVSGWAVMLFECAFPLALVLPRFAPILIALAIVFHVGNAWVFGLNRFLWAWLAGYPALLWCAGYLRGI